MRLSSWILLCGSAVGYGIYESAFAAAAPYPVNCLRPLPAILVMLTLINRQKAAYVAAGLAGAAADLLAAGPSGFMFARWLFMALAIDTLSETVTTNRSLFAAATLVTAACVGDWMLSWLGQLVSSWLSRGAQLADPFKVVLTSYAVDLLVVATLFVVFTMFTRRFLVTVSAARPTAYEP